MRLLILIFYFSSIIFHFHSTEAASKVLCNLKAERSAIDFLSDISNLCSHLVLPPAMLHNESLIIDSNSIDGITKMFKAMKNSSATNLRMLLKIGSNRDSELNSLSYSKLISNKKSMKEFIGNINKIIDTHKFNGLIIDWRYPSCWIPTCTGPPEDKENFVLFIEELSTALKTNNHSLFIVTPPEIKKLNHSFPRIKDVIKLIDGLIVVNRDIHGTWDEYTDHFAPFDYFRKTIRNYISEKIDPKKIFIDIPLYGSALKLADVDDTNVGALIRRGLHSKAYGRDQLCKLQSDTKKMIKVQYKSTSLKRDPFIVDGDEWISFDDFQQIWRKTKKIKNHKLGGVMVYWIEDDVSDDCLNTTFPSLKIINDALGLRKIDGKSGSKIKNLIEKIIYDNGPQSYWTLIGYIFVGVILMVLFVGLLEHLIFHEPKFGGSYNVAMRELSSFKAQNSQARDLNTCQINSIT